MGDGDDLPTLAWRVSKLEQMQEDQRKERATVRLFAAGVLVSSLVNVVETLINARVF
jgi:hypothetical protein